MSEFYNGDILDTPARPIFKLYNVGERIKAVKFGVDVEGIVTDWRSKYGGSVQYTVKLDTPVKFSWRPQELVNTILVNCSEVKA